MPLFETVKLFDLAKAPSEIQSAEDFQALKSTSTSVALSPLLWICVGDHGYWNVDSDTNEPDSSTTSLSEYLLHTWLAEQGAGTGETVILTWSPG